MIVEPFKPVVGIIFIIEAISELYLLLLAWQAMRLTIVAFSLETFDVRRFVKHYIPIRTFQLLKSASDLLMSTVLKLWLTRRVGAARGTK